ncbi:hypothetical protein FS749_003542 [Ceratobasidium sp. UAMH 11750]|nr:hypothetical protein FS749_003542 [Ceratobasidium sp. UAMH 11750]
MGLLDDTFGATYIGVVLATFFYGILTLQTYIYWVRYVHDTRFERLFVSPPTLGIETSTLNLPSYLTGRSAMGDRHAPTRFHLPHAVLVCDRKLCQSSRITVQQLVIQRSYSISSRCHFPSSHQPYFKFQQLEVGLTAIITFMVQAFFARRAWQFTSRVGNRMTATPKTKVLGALIGLMSLMQLGFGMGCFGMVWVLKMYQQFIAYRWLVAGWLTSAALCDVLIVYMLSTALMTQRTGFGRTDALIDKLLRYTINTGLLTSIIAIVDLIAFCTMNNLVHLCFNFILGKLYTNTLLATLNAREVTPPENIVHVESGSYQLDKVSHSRKYSRSAGTVLSGQERSNPVVHIQTDTEAQTSETSPYQRHPQEKYTSPRVVVLPGKGKTDEYDPDADSFEKGRGY